MCCPSWRIHWSWEPYWFAPRLVWHARCCFAIHALTNGRNCNETKIDLIPEEPIKSREDVLLDLGGFVVGYLIAGPLLFVVEYYSLLSHQIDRHSTALWYELCSITPVMNTEATTPTVNVPSKQEISHHDDSGLWRRLCAIHHLEKRLGSLRSNSWGSDVGKTKGNKQNIQQGGKKLAFNSRDKYSSDDTRCVPWHFVGYVYVFQFLRTTFMNSYEIIFDSTSFPLQITDSSLIIFPFANVGI